MTMENDEEFWTQTHTMEQAYRKIIHETNDYKAFNKDTERDGQFIMDKLKIEKDDEVLDFGCGIGRLLLPLSKKCKKITGVDVSGNMISLAEAYITKHKSKDMGLIALSPMPNAYTFPVKANAFDKAYSFIVLQHMNKYIAFANIMNIYQALKFGGVALLQFPNLEHQFREFFTHVNYYTMMTIPTARMHYYLKEELEILFKPLKFSNIEIWKEGVDIWVRCKK